MRLIVCAVILLLSTFPAGAQPPTPALPGALERKAVVQVVFETSPDGATVTLLDMQKEVLGQSGRPLQLAFPAERERPLHLQLHLDGYEDRDLEIPTSTLRGATSLRLPADGPLTLLPLSPLSPLRLFLRRHPWQAATAALLALAGLGWALPRQLRLLRRHALMRRLLPRGDKDPNLGKVFADWLLVRRLGVGGTATVYEAVSWGTLDPRQAVAVKVMHPAFATDEYRARFAREVRIGLSLDHPNIVRLLDWSDAGTFCIVMELVAGAALSRRIPRPQGMPLSEARPVLQAVFSAVSYAHSRGIVHNDLKPGNIMLTGDGQVRVMDFGIATGASLTRLTATGDSLGTPGYMAPEQYDGVRSEPASDQYALGCIAFEMLAGQPPFSDPDLMVRMAAHLKKPPPRLSSLRGDLPAALSDVIDRMLAKKAADRWPSVEAAWRALDAALT